MDSLEIRKSSKKSVKWSLLTEFFAKIATPLSTAILARILAPEIFGITAAVTIVVTFCEAITDTGFAKFIIQHDFKNEDEYKKYISISICFSMLLSILLFGIICIFRSEISRFVGCPGYENILIISCIQLPFFGFNSIFVAHLRRNFKFNWVFVCRVLYCLAPFVFTVPLAILKLGPWALAIGAIAAQVVQTPFLLFKCRKVIKPYFSFKLLGKMISSSYLMIIESIVIWMSTWVLTFISTQFFSSHIVGIVKVSNSTINSLFALFSTSFTNVLFATLSRLKNDDEEYKNSFYSIQSCAFVIVVPLAVGCYFYSDTIVKVFLGSQWMEASSIIAALAIAVAFRICFNNFISEVFRSKGHFVSSIIFHLVSIGLNISLKFAFGRESLSMFAWTTAFSNIAMMILAISILRFRYGFSVLKQASSLIPSIVCCVFMVPMLIMQNTSSYKLFQSIFQVVACVGCYIAGGFILYRPLFRHTLSYIGLGKLINQKE